MKKSLSTGVLLLTVVFSTALAQTETGSREPKSAEKPAVGSATRNKESAAAQETASVKGGNSSSAADPEKRNNVSGNVDEATLTSIYRVGVGDVLDIRLLNSATTRSTLFTVMEGGLIEFPLVGGSMTVAGLTTD